MSAKTKGFLLPILFSLFAVGCLVAWSGDAFAAEGASSGRKIWDNIMLVFNFGVLVFLFIKFAKKPLMNYLRGVRTKIEEELQRMRAMQKDVETARDAEADKMKDLDRHLEEIRSSIIEMGEREKARIIEQGKASAERMIHEAEAYAEYRVAMARKELSDEMVDMAVGMVEERLAEAITEEDQDRMISYFVTDLEKSKGRMQ